MTIGSRMLAALLVVAGASAWFVVSTVTMDELPDQALVASAALVALVLVSAFSGTPTRARMAGASRTSVAAAIVGGALAWAAAPLAVLMVRATDAPSGTESLFFTTAGWALAGVLVAYAFRSERPRAIHITGALFAVLGAAALLASWERPSSFSPFVKFPGREAVMLAAGVAFALGSLALVYAARALGPRSALWLGLAGAAALGLAATVTSGVGDAASYARIWPQLLLLAAALASLSTGWLRLLSSDGLVRSSALLFVPPVAITVLSLLERATGAYGVNPILWPATLAGSAIAAAGAALLWVVPRAGTRAHTTDADSARPVTLGPAQRSWLAFSVGAALVGGVAGAASLALPAFAASSQGVVGNGASFSVAWTMVGAESAAGWLPLLIALLVLSAAWERFARGASRSRAWSALVGMVGVASYPLLVATPLTTWNRWIPADVQQAYGTEYARLVMSPVSDSVRLVALALVGVACLALAASWAGAGPQSDPTPPDTKGTA